MGKLLPQRTKLQYLYGPVSIGWKTVKRNLRKERLHLYVRVYSHKPHSIVNKDGCCPNNIIYIPFTTFFSRINQRNRLFINASYHPVHISFILVVITIEYLYFIAASFTISGRKKDTTVTTCLAATSNVRRNEIFYMKLII